jgi:hypothetical protein
VALLRSRCSPGWHPAGHLVLPLRVQAHLGEQGASHDLVS